MGDVPITPPSRIARLTASPVNSRVASAVAGRRATKFPSLDLSASLYATTSSVLHSVGPVGGSRRRTKLFVRARPQAYLQSASICSVLPQMLRPHPLQLLELAAGFRR